MTKCGCFYTIPCKGLTFAVYFMMKGEQAFRKTGMSGFDRGGRLRRASRGALVISLNKGKNVTGRTPAYAYAYAA